VEQGGDNGVSEEEGSFQRMGDVGFAGHANLPAVTVVGILVSPPDQFNGVFRQVVGYPVNQKFNVGVSYPISFSLIYTIRNVIIIPGGCKV
jgi:hypothetical protein